MGLVDNTTIDDGLSDERMLFVPLVVLAFGHMLSNLLRTIPAIALDIMAAEFGSTPQALASLMSVYHFAFAASQIPVGAALDRFGVRIVSLCLLGGTAWGAAFSGLSTGAGMFLLGQFLLGVCTSGMLMCPMTLAAKRLPVRWFGLWSGLILSLGNMGMLVSSSPLAWLVENHGWRSGFWLSSLVGITIAGLVFAFVPKDRPYGVREISPLREMAGVVRIGASGPLRGIVILSLVSLAASLVLRGLWGGPWLMDAKGLNRIEAGNVLGIFTIALIVGPLLIGALDRKVGHRRTMIAAAHLTAAGFLLLMAGGGPDLFVSRVFGLKILPPQYDAWLFVLFGIAASAQPLIYAMTRQVVQIANTGKALSAVNLAFFLGAALMQSTTGLIAGTGGIPAVLVFMAACLVMGSVVFLAMTRPANC